MDVWCFLLGETRARLGTSMGQWKVSIKIPRKDLIIEVNPKIVHLISKIFSHV